MDRIVVDQFNTVSVSGSGTAAQRLHQGLRTAGIDSRLWIKRPKHGNIPRADGLCAIDWPFDDAGQPVRRWMDQVTTYLRKQWNKWNLAAAIRGRPPGFEVFTTPQRDRQTSLDRRIFQGDIVHLHWVTGFIDWPSFFASVPDDLPIVWTLHDMNPITGGCHHADTCRNFVTSCQNCPQLGRRGVNDLSAAGFAIKQAAYRRKQLHLVTPSHWLERQVRSSALMAGASSVQTIRNGLDLTEYRPIEKLAARQQLGLPTDRFVVGFGADSLKNPRKGIAELFDAFARLPDLDRICGITLGRKELPSSPIPRPLIIPMGYVEDARRQALIYSAMDVFALPSWGENLPQMAVEALACATPVVAFDVGGVPEIVHQNETGLLAPLRDCQRLAEHLAWCQEHPSELRQFGERGRRMVEREFDLRLTTTAYQQLYLSVLAHSSRSRTPAHAA